MKRIILLILILLICSCYDYKEVNDLAFVSSLAIDYDNKYHVTAEIINDSEDMENKPIIVESEGISLGKAFENLNSKANKTLFYHHLKIIIISPIIAKNNLYELTDYLIRSPEIRNEFYLTLYDGNNTADIFNNSNDITGDKIAKTIETNKNSAYNKSFEDMFEKLLNKKIDPVMNVIALDKDNIVIKGLAIFKDYTYIKTINSKEAIFFNVLDNNNISFVLNKKYHDKNFTINVYDYHTSYIFNKNKTIIKIKAKGDILENGPNFNLHDKNTYEKINNDFKIIIKKNITHLTKELQSSKCDILGLNYYQFKKTKKDNKKILNNKIIIKIDFEINRKGLIYETK